jgi:TIGR03009 family protein
MHFFLRTSIIAAGWLAMLAHCGLAQSLLPPQGNVPRTASGAIQQVQQVGAPQPAAGQQLAPQQPNQPAAAAQPPAAPPGFQLNQLQQANLDVVLNAWQAESIKINTFHCTFERLEYDPAFGPSPIIPLFWNTGELSFQKPDKGSFQIKEVKKWQPAPAAPAAPAPPAVAPAGKWVADPKAVGEHWVCDGQNIYEYRHDQKQLVVRQIPPQMQGQAIVDGPLPFLFGADANKLKQRYWMVVNGANVQLDPNQIMISAVPKWASDAANYKSVDVILAKPAMMPSSMQIVLPNNGRYVYKFNLDKAKVNDRFEQIKSWFKAPEILPGWQKVVEPMPVEQAMQPNQAPR